jgi:hypothetical protein
MSGLEGRCGLLFRLGDALEASPQFFGTDPKRPGNMLGTLAMGDWLMIDYLKPTGEGEGVELSKIWSIVMDGFGPVWPASRTQLDGVSLGDAWPCNTLPGDGEKQM